MTFVLASVLFCLGGLLLGLLDEGFELLHGAQQSVGHLLEVQPRVLLAVAHRRPRGPHRGQRPHRPHLQTVDQARRWGGHGNFGLHWLGGHGQGWESRQHCERERQA